MTSSFSTTNRPRRSRAAEALAWLGALAASTALAFGVYSLASRPFSTTIDSPLALPKELAITSQNVNVPLPGVDDAGTTAGSEPTQTTSAAAAIAAVAASETKASAKSKSTSTTTPSPTTADAGTAAPAAATNAGTIAPVTTPSATSAPTGTTPSSTAPTPSSAAPVIPSPSPTATQPQAPTTTPRLPDVPTTQPAEETPAAGASGDNTDDDGPVGSLVNGLAEVAR